MRKKWKSSKSSKLSDSRNKQSTWQNTIPKYEPQRWSEPLTKKSHNCYSYFLNKTSKKHNKECIYKNNIRPQNNKKTIKRKFRKHDKECGKPQPGYYAGHRLYNKKKNFTCKRMEKRVFSDNPSIRKTTRKCGCKNKEYMGAMVIKPYDTFHFYRQDADKGWSHKLGSTRVSRKDGNGKRIRDPKTSNRNFGHGLKYKNFCGYYCLPYSRRKKHQSVFRLKRRRKGKEKS